MNNLLKPFASMGGKNGIRVSVIDEQALQQTGEMSRVHLPPGFMALGRGSSHPVTVNRISKRK